LLAPLDLDQPTSTPSEPATGHFYFRAFTPKSSKPQFLRAVLPQQVEQFVDAPEVFGLTDRESVTVQSERVLADGSAPTVDRLPGFGSGLTRHMASVIVLSIIWIVGWQLISVVVPSRCRDRPLRSRALREAQHFTGGVARVYRRLSVGILVAWAAGDGRRLSALRSLWGGRSSRRD
jgi:hypothetical protein